MLKKIKAKLQKWHNTINNYITYTYYTIKYPLPLLSKLPKSSHVVFTHNCGGGSELFLHNVMENQHNIIIIRPTKCQSRFITIYEINSDSKQYFILSTRQLFLFLEKISTTDILINSLVGYKDLFILCKKLSTIKKYPITYMLHDYHCICPTINLLSNKMFCQLKCSECQHHINIEKYRFFWKMLLMECKEIKTFSISSKKLLEIAYPNINNTKITVTPHDMSYFIHSNLPIKGKPIKLGIIGNVSCLHKGKEVLDNLFAYMSKSTNIETTIIGTYSDKIPYQNVIQTGKYNTENLVNLCIEHNITVAFMPSICPETFSYVIHELIALNIPTVCLNLGAQAEYIKQYKYGVISPSAEPAKILKCLQQAYALGQINSIS